MGKVIIFGVGGLIGIGLVALAIILIGGIAPKITSLFWKNKTKGEEKREITPEQNPYSDARWRTPDEHDRL